MRRHQSIIISVKYCCLERLYNGESSYGSIINLQYLSWLYQLRYALVDENTIQFKTIFDFRKIDRTAIKSFIVALHTSRDVQRSKYIIAIIKRLHTNNVVHSEKIKPNFVLARSKKSSLVRKQQSH